MNLKTSLKSLFPPFFHKLVHIIKRGIYTTPLYHRCIVKRKVERLRRKEKIRVLFISYTPTMWKVDSLCKAMLAHKRFEVEVLISPNFNIENREARDSEYKRLKVFFERKKYPIVEFCRPDGRILYDKIPAEYDLLFYPQSGGGGLPRPLDMYRSAGRLTICSDYSFHCGNQNYSFNKWYQNSSWIDCYENDTVYNLSCLLKCNKGLNSCVTGLPIVDDFTRSEYSNCWKAQQAPCKRIIWAPHWTLVQQRSILPCYSNFIEMADYMLKLAHTHIGSLQIAFKPHPWLKQELYKHPDWGQARTDAYYAAWENGINTQLEQGEYVDLFMTSDAMIHDSSSFIYEYLLTGKPVLFMVRNENKQVEQLNEISRAAFYSQYIGHSIKELEHFLHEQVIAAYDPMKERRREIVAKYLTPPHGKTAAQNIIDSILGTPL